LAHLVGQPVDLFGRVDYDADGEADAAGAGFGFSVPVTGELRDGEQRKQDAAQFEDGKLPVIHDLRPAQAAVEVAQPGEVVGAEGDQVGERWLISHVDTMPAWVGNAPIAGGVASLCSS